MYQNYQQNNFQNQMGSNVNSQYRGLETKYQPIGYVQSQYNQSLNPSFSNQFQASSNQYSNFQSQAPQSFHTANYRGDQPGHDAYLRSDSSQPAQSQFSGNYMSQAPAYGSFGASYSNQSYAQQSPQSYHTASYRGDQQGHDAYLRSDSSQPAQSQYGMMGTANYSSFNTGMGSSFGSSQTYGQQQQFQSPQSYHTASYRGNQQGHDAYLRSDSSQPAQSQMGTQSFGYNRYQF